MQFLHRPFRVGQEMVHGLLVALHRLGQPRQRLAFGFGQHPQFQLGELFEVAHIVKYRAVVSALRIDTRDGLGGGSYSRHDGLLLVSRGVSCPLLSGLRADSVPKMTNVGLGMGRSLSRTSLV